jgi:hypothetical protein
VATDRQIAASRANSKKSTGPKSRGGKRRASQDAHSHRMAVRSPIDPDWIAKVEHQACDGGIVLSHARSIARAQHDLLRARSLSAALVAKALASHMDGGMVSSSLGRSPLDTDRAGAVELAVPLFRVLDRYENRARRTELPDFVSRKRWGEQLIGQTNPIFSNEFKGSRNRGNSIAAVCATSRSVPNP